MSDAHHPTQIFWSLGHGARRKECTVTQVMR